MLCVMVCTIVLVVSIVLVFFMIRRPPRSTRTDTHFPYTTLFRASSISNGLLRGDNRHECSLCLSLLAVRTAPHRLCPWRYAHLRKSISGIDQPRRQRRGNTP